MRYSLKQFVDASRRLADWFHLMERIDRMTIESVKQPDPFGRVPLGPYLESFRSAPQVSKCVNEWAGKIIAADGDSSRIAVIGSLRSPTAHTLISLKAWDIAIELALSRPSGEEYMDSDWTVLSKMEIGISLHEDDIAEHRKHLIDLVKNKVQPIEEWICMTHRLHREQALVISMYGGSEEFPTWSIASLSRDLDASPNTAKGYIEKAGLMLGDPGKGREYTPDDVYKICVAIAASKASHSLKASARQLMETVEPLMVNPPVSQD